MPSSTGAPTRFGPSLVLARTIALVNAAGPPAAHAPTTATVEQVLREHGEPDPVVVADELAPLIDVARSLFAVCAAQTEDAAAAAINALLRAYGHAPRLTAHDNTRWHLHIDSSDDAPLHVWVAASGALALAGMLAESGRGGWGICAAEGCERVFLRTGEGRRRSACSDRCATRARVREHRRRRSGEPGSAGGTAQ